MILMGLSLDGIYGFHNFTINFSYPKKIVNSLPQCQVVNSKFDIKMFEANFLTNKLICPII